MKARCGSDRGPKWIWPAALAWTLVLTCAAPVLAQQEAQPTAPSTPAAPAAPSALPKQYVFPGKGQSPEQQKSDEAACHTWAVQQTGFDPSAPPPRPTVAPTQAPPKGGVARGAVRGAARGYIIGDIANDEGGEGAAIGAVTGAARTAKKQQAAGAAAQQQRAAQQQQYDQTVQQRQGEYLKARSACLEAKGYTVK